MVTLIRREERPEVITMGDWIVFLVSTLSLGCMKSHRETIHVILKVGLLFWWQITVLLLLLLSSTAARWHAKHVQNLFSILEAHTTCTGIGWFYGCHECHYDLVLLHAVFYRIKDTTFWTKVSHSQSGVIGYSLSWTQRWGYYCRKRYSSASTVIPNEQKP